MNIVKSYLRIKNIFFFTLLNNQSLLLLLYKLNLESLCFMLFSHGHLECRKDESDIFKSL